MHLSSKAQELTGISVPMLFDAFLSMHLLEATFYKATNYSTIPQIKHLLSFCHQQLLFFLVVTLWKSKNLTDLFLRLLLRYIKYEIPNHKKYLSLLYIHNVQ